MENGLLSKEAKKKALLLPFIVALLGAILLVSTLLLPYSTATGEYAERIREYPDEIVYEELDLTVKDLANISMVKYASIYNNLSEQFWGNSTGGILYIVLVAAIGVFALLTLLFTVLKKPIAVIVFDVLAFAVFCLQNFDYSARGVIPNERYAWGTAYYLFFAAVAVTFAGAVWMLIKRAQLKKADTAQTA